MSRLGSKFWCPFRLTTMQLPKENQPNSPWLKVNTKANRKHTVCPNFHSEDYFDGKTLAVFFFSSVVEGNLLLLAFTRNLAASLTILMVSNRSEGALFLIWGLRLWRMSSCIEQLLRRTWCSSSKIGSNIGNSAINFKDSMSDDEQCMQMRLKGLLLLAWYLPVSTLNLWALILNSANLFTYCKLRYKSRKISFEKSLLISL